MVKSESVGSLCDLLEASAIKCKPMEVQFPYYFSLESAQENCFVPYRVDGYNHTYAQWMLNKQIHPTCKECSTRCMFDKGEEFSLLQFTRLENRETFRRYKEYEKCVAETMVRQKVRQDVRYSQNTQLKKLAEKNGLSIDANTVYLLHGTEGKNVESIMENGLKTKFSLETQGIYGKGLYFSDTFQRCN